MLEALWAIVGGAVGGALVAFWNAYLGGYGGEKGKTLARREDLDTILAEIRQVTITQKEIEHRLSGDLWEKQSRWTEKKRMYGDLLSLINEEDTIIRHLQQLYEKRPHALNLMGEGKQIIDVTQELKRLSELGDKFAYIEGLTKIFLDEAAEAALHKYSQGRKYPVKFQDDSSWLEQARAKLTKLYKTILEVAKQDLVIR